MSVSPSARMDLLRNPKLFKALAFLLCLMPVLGALAPRLLAGLPAILGIAFFLAHRVMEGNWPHISRTHLLAFAFVLLLPFASVLWSIDPGFALDRSFKIALTILPGLLLLAALNTPWADQIIPCFFRFLPLALIAGLAITVINLSCWGAIQVALDGFERDPDFNLSNFNRASSVLTISLFAGLYALQRASYSDKSRRNIFAALLLLMGALLCLTDSQSAHLAFAAAILPFLFFPVQSKAAWTALWGIIFVLLLGAPFLAQVMFDLYPRELSNLDWFKYSYALERLEIWDFVSRYALQSPLYGYGIEATRMIENFDSETLYFPEAKVLHPHNFALQFWIEFGVIGVMVCAGFFGFIFRQLHRMETQAARTTLAMFFAILSIAATGYGLWQGWWLGVMLMAAIYSVIFSRAGGGA